MKRRVCNGQTHKVRSDGTRITCQDGKFKAVRGRKGKAEEEDNLGSIHNFFGFWIVYKFLCLACEWYGQVYCSGDIIQDLYEWWFKMRCSKGRMMLESRQWRDVVTDPRFMVGILETDKI